MHRKIGKLAMFGGHIELNETPWETVLHEITEESGYLPEQVQILQPKHRLTSLPGCVVHPTPFAQSTGHYPQDILHYHSDIFHILVTDEDPAGIPDEGESTDIRVLTAAELRAVPDDQIIEAWRILALDAMDYYLHEWEPVPFNTYK